jgi:hypothetical protein
MTEVKSVIPFPPYDYRVYVLFTDDIIASADKLADEGILTANHNIDDTTQAFCVKPRNRSFGYVVLQFSAKPMHIAHESYHAVSSIMKWIGAAHEEEVMAYHIGYLVGLIHKDQEKAQKKLDKLKKQ